VKQLKVGLPTDPEVVLTPVGRIGDFYEFLEDAQGKGGKLLCGGSRVNHLGIPDKNGRFITPAVISVEDVSDSVNMKCIKEENFFPLMPLVKVSANKWSGQNRINDSIIFKSMVEVANKNMYGLRTSVWASSEFYIQKFSEHIQNSGLLRINSPHIGFSPLLATHGGTGKTGGPYGELNYIWEKTTHLQGVSLTKLDESSV